MLKPSLFRVDLRRLILSLAVMSALITLANSFYATYQVQRQQLIDTTLTANRIYAAKLAAISEVFFASASGQLAYSASQLANDFENDAVQQSETNRLLSQTESFNSVAVVDASGVVRAISPQTIAMKGSQLTSPGALEALRLQAPVISPPYTSLTGNLVVFISAPIFAADGQYLGYVGGSIYLKQPNILHGLLAENYATDEAFTYVIDPGGRILFHKDAAMIGQQLADGQDTQATLTSMMRDREGSVQIQRHSGGNALAGFATIPMSGWKIVTLSTIHTTLISLQGLMLSVLYKIAPLTLLTLLSIWLLSQLISKPLGQLAQRANEMDSAGVSQKITSISSWYFEAQQLKRAMLLGISMLQKKITTLNSEAQTDPMTGLLNRRGLKTTLELWRSQQQPFAVIALDIDHFKQVNDNYGHDAGDEVIKRLAMLIRNSAREGDALCRIGGEEFLMLLPQATLMDAGTIAQRVRLAVEQNHFPEVGAVTLSAGVALWSARGDEMGEAFKIADDALYQAKRAGRNQVIMAGD